ncbi:MAG: DUF4115 domain-containing protein [Pseudomonadota bacterium]|nr:DUF4115 domain-containing protein [Pseudomonadota bacterium]
MIQTLKRLANNLLSADQEQASPTEYCDIGRLFSTRRQELGQDLNAIAAYLRIRPEYLEAIEADRFNMLPGYAYALGFVRSYSTYLGLDPEDMGTRFKQADAGIEETPLLILSTMPKSHAPTWILVGIAIVLAVSLFGGWVAVDRHGGLADSVPDLSEVMDPVETIALIPVVPTPVIKPKPIDADAPLPVTEILAMVDVAPVEATETEEIAEIEDIQVVMEDLFDLPESLEAEPETRTGRTYGIKTGDVRVELRGKGECWIGVENEDGDQIVSRVLYAGDVYRAPDDPTLKLTIGNAAGIEMIIDGQVMPQLGKANNPIMKAPLDADALLERFKRSE